MAAPKIPERIAWAAELLAPAAGERVLEIGCGRGVAARLVAQGLKPGGYLGLDRSTTALAAARTLNPELDFIEAPFAEFDAGRRRFDAVFAINVNAFCVGGAAEIAAAKRALKPAARLLLVYEPPSPSSRAGMLAKLEAALCGGGFRQLKPHAATRSGKPLLAIEARI